MAEFLTQNGQQILPPVELITQSRMVIDDLVDAVRRATIEAVLPLSAEHMAGPPQQGRRGEGEIHWLSLQPLLSGLACQTFLSARSQDVRNVFPFLFSSEFGCVRRPCTGARFSEKQSGFATEAAARLALALAKKTRAAEEIQRTAEARDRHELTFARYFQIWIDENATLPNAATLLHFKNRELRERAADSLKDSFSRAEWEELQAITRRQDWKEEVLSTKNRLMRFVASKSVRRFMGLEQNNIDLTQVMDEGKILLVNLGSSDYLDREAARVFASLFLNEFFETAMRRATKVPAGEKPRPFTLYLDEFQEYITEDVAAMLDQVRKGGLHMVLAHQHLGHFEDNNRLKESVFTNARIRAVFGGLSIRAPLN